MFCSSILTFGGLDPLIFYIAYLVKVQTPRIRGNTKFLGKTKISPLFTLPNISFKGRLQWLAYKCVINPSPIIISIIKCVTINIDGAIFHTWNKKFGKNSKLMCVSAWTPLLIVKLLRKNISLIMKYHYLLWQFTLTDTNSDN